MLIEELRPDFDAIEKLFALSTPWEPPIPPTPTSPDPGDLTFELYDFTFKVPDNGQQGWLDVKGQLIRRDGASIPLRGADGGDVLAVHDNFKNLGYIVPGQGIPSGDSPKWKDLRYLKLDFKAGDHDVTVIVGATATDTNGQSHPIFQDWNWTWIPTQQADSKLIVIPDPPPVPIPPPPPTPLDRLSPDERSLRARLIAHLNENQVYYWRQIWMGEDPNARIYRLVPKGLTWAAAIPSFSMPLRIA